MTVTERSQMPVECFVTETPLRVRYVEADAMQRVHHSNYIVYFEEGRSNYARKRGQPYGDIEQNGILLLVTEIAVRYHNPAQYEDLITVRTWVSAVQSRGMTFNYEIVDAGSGELLVTGFTKHICIEPNGKIVRVPEQWRDWAKHSNHLVEGVV